ncbi:cytochrome c oxidase subunit II [Luteimonas yindakuii]|uniref:Cytochrome c oxidase subunit 2 n=1 Tax=Luteimonas yindakuii TaxID=2565782 RepID=A0A4Z1R1A6_9GAMM|nr:cytochrome c oxidase subunit II [Luteimonas yindakuii]TKS53290.1 cytochrome c oxidase subunit II [Luteimonas yindakuii]
MRCALVALAMSAPVTALAQSADPHRWQLNMGRGVTSTAQHAYDAHMFALWVCVAIGLIVFGAMAYAMFAFRKSKGAVAAQFSHNTMAEVIWTVIPVILLVIMAIPATQKLIAMYDTRDSAMTVKVTGYQWMWTYEYMGEDVTIVSRLDRESDRLRQDPSVTRAQLEAHGNYLLEVDNELVLPVDTKVRFVITADDVIHSWWVPALGWKQDAIPGIINEAWTEITVPGVYRGQCAELCGKDHAFMPIVVRAVPREEFDGWLAAEKAANAPQPAAPAVPAAPADEPAADTDATARIPAETIAAPVAG